MPSNRVPRGVWRLPHLVDGHAVAIAVDSKGRRVAAITLLPGVANAGVKDVLTELLDAVDPQPKLALLTNEAPDEELPPLSAASHLLLHRHRA
jgi:hypothetical protein